MVIPLMSHPVSFVLLVIGEIVIFNKIISRKRRLFSFNNTLLKYKCKKLKKWLPQYSIKRFKCEAEQSPINYTVKINIGHTAG